MATSRIILDPKKASEHVSPPFDFSGKLIPANQNITAETISSVISTTITVWTGVDPNPGALYGGSTVIDGNNTRVLPLIVGGITGVIYNIAVLVLTSASRQLELNGLLAITPSQM